MLEDRNLSGKQRWKMAQELMKATELGSPIYHPSYQRMLSIYSDLYTTQVAGAAASAGRQVRLLPCPTLRAQLDDKRVKDAFSTQEQAFILMVTRKYTKGKLDNLATQVASCKKTKKKIVAAPAVATVASKYEEVSPTNYEEEMKSLEPNSKEAGGLLIMPLGSPNKASAKCSSTIMNSSPRFFSVTEILQILNRDVPQLQEVSKVSLNSNHQLVTYHASAADNESLDTYKTSAADKEIETRAASSSFHHRSKKHGSDLLITCPPPHPPLTLAPPPQHKQEQPGGGSPDKLATHLLLKDPQDREEDGDEKEKAVDVMVSSDFQVSDAQYYSRMKKSLERTEEQMTQMAQKRKASSVICYDAFRFLNRPLNKKITATATKHSGRRTATMPPAKKKLMLHHLPPSCNGRSRPMAPVSSSHQEPWSVHHSTEEQCTPPIPVTPEKNLRDSARL
jgi:hypothetical protein